MTLKEKYIRYKYSFLNDGQLCHENKLIFEEYFNWQERKLKSINNLRDLDKACYKTLYIYVSMFKNVVKWFDYKPLQNITKAEIKKVYENLEDGKILNFHGAPFEDRGSYYTKIFKGKLFKMIGKFEYAEEILEFAKPEKNKNKVRFFPEEDFSKALMVAMKLHHKAFLQLYWDIGENVMTIVQLQKKDCTRMIDKETNEPEYLINLPKEKIKRSRTCRTEITNYPETVEFLDMIFNQGKKKFIPDPNGKDFQRIHGENGTRIKVRGNWTVVPFSDDDYLFDFKEKQAEQIFRRCVDITSIRCQPNNERPSLKDIRSSMACHLLKQGWSVDEVKARMGHKPSSKAIDRYVTYLALDKHVAKRRLHESDIKKYQCQLEESQQREKKYLHWAQKQQNEVAELKSLLEIYISKMNQLEQLQQRDSIAITQ